MSAPPNVLTNLKTSAEITIVSPITPDHVPAPKKTLQRGETNFKPTVKHKAKEFAGYRFEEFKYIGSVIPVVIIPTIIITLWSVLWTVLIKTGITPQLAISPQLISIISVVMGLLLVFRTNTAYDRYWEARRIWGTMSTNIRNLARFIWIAVYQTNKKDLSEKFGAINLLLAFSIATKHYLREEHGYHYDDLHNLLIHVPDFSPGNYHPESQDDNLPLEITFHISAYIAKCRKREMMDVPTTASMIASLSALVDNLSNLERIRDSPVPIAYTIHLKQTLILYLITLPFQLVNLLGYFTIITVAIASFILMGIEAIGHEIENPFGYDANDLDQEGFCQKLKDELYLMVDRPTVLDSANWSVPVDIKDNSQMVSISQKTLIK
ncbi:Bestrophin, RFP-TM, chloride channel-domain-containing protein [Globomyces pollinis-pini]|nr:Bestrophin, RFP-TM, chloride channel-domain-containing protein [Globomyces pollinis-pini]